MAGERVWITETFSGKLPKENENIDDCQDFYKCDQRGRFAIADGASQSFYSNIWAEKLVAHFCKDPDINESNWEQWLRPIQKEWFSDINQRVEKAREDNRPTWVTNQNRLKFGECATSTFVGLEFVDNKVKISVVGDSYLFILEEDKLSETYPKLACADDFGDRPEYFASDGKDNSFQPILESKVLEDTNSQKHFILATDALSEYIFKCHERNEEIFSTLLKFSKMEDFREFIFDARHSHKIKLKNDDVALVVLRVSTENRDKKIVKLRKIEGGLYDNGNARKNRGRVEKDFSSKQSQKSTTTPFALLTSGGQPFSAFSNKTLKNSSFETGAYPPNRREMLKAEAEINSLKRQRILLLVTLGIAALFFIVGDSFLDRSRATIQENSSANRTSANQTYLAGEGKQILSGGTLLYPDEKLINSIFEVPENSSITVDVTKQGDRWYKVKMKLYAYQPDIRDKEAADELRIPLYTKSDAEGNTFFVGYLPRESNSPKRGLFGGLFERGPWTQVELEVYVRR